MKDEIARTLAWLLLLALGWAGTEVRYWFKRRAKRPARMIEADSAKAGQQKEILRKLCEETGAMRAYLCKVHNGDYFIDGSPVMKMSRVAEATRPGTSYESERFKNVFTSTISEEMDLIAKDGPSFFVVHDLPPCQFKWLCEKTGVVAGARCAIRSKDGPVAAIGLDFDRVEPPEALGIACDYAKWLARTL